MPGDALHSLEHALWLEQRFRSAEINGGKQTLDPTLYADFSRTGLLRSQMGNPLSAMSAICTHIYPIR